MAVPFFFFFQGQQQIIKLPKLTFKAILTFGGRHPEGQLVDTVADPWFAINQMIQRDPASIHRIDWRDLEEIVAGGLGQAGFDEVILTPR